jgi:hypothetical protein
MLGLGALVPLPELPAIVLEPPPQPEMKVLIINANRVEVSKRRHMATWMLSVRLE